MPHKCLFCKSVWVNDDREYCNSCEKSLFGNGSIRNGDEEENRSSDNSGSPECED